METKQKTQQQQKTKKQSKTKQEAQGSHRLPLKEFQ